MEDLSMWCKTCRMCNEVKPFTEFYKHPKTADGVQSYCKLCMRRYYKDKYKTDSDFKLAANERVRTWRRRNIATDPRWRLLQSIRINAPRRGLEVSIEQDDLYIPRFCPYLEIPIYFDGPREMWPSVDRMDNTKGYVPGNVEVISYKANLMKSDTPNSMLVRFAVNVLKRFAPHLLAPDKMDAP